MLKANISLCIIVKDEPLLEQCILSIKDYVTEIVIVDTGSTDDITQKIAKKYADIFEVYTECNDPDTGLINDFSKARNRSFELATKPWVMWVDADDTIVGADKLLRLTQEFDNQKNSFDSVVYLFPYEYSHDAQGNCTCKHYRERLFYGKENFTFVNPVHEVCVPSEHKKINFLKCEDITYIHHRHGVKESGRNLRILRKYFETNSNDPRQMYYLGLECTTNGFVDEAIDLFIKYIDVSGWDEERIMACLKLVDIYQSRGAYEEGLKWALKGISIYENWGECYFAAARMYYYMATRNDNNSRRNWERCIYFAETGLSQPPTQTVLFLNPLEREFEIYKYLNVAYNAIGDVESALKCINTALSRREDPNMLCNKRIYEKFLLTQNVEHTLLTGSIDISQANTIKNIINHSSLKSQTGFTPVYSGEWTIPSTWDFENLPIELSTEQLQSVVIMLWKQYILHDEIILSQKFLENAPYMVRNSDATQRALKISKSMTAWIKDPDLAQEHNSPEVELRDTEIGAKLPNPLIGQQGARFDTMVSYLPDISSTNKKTSIIDFGCFDGAFTNRYAMKGYDVTGVDLVKTSVDLANKKAKEFSTGAQHIQCYFQDVENVLPHHTFDYAISTEAYEHLIDPVRDLLIPAKKMLKSDGKFLLGTPHGAWFRGKYVSWAHPWCFEKQNGTTWLDPNPRGHVLAPDTFTLTKHLNEAGFWVKNSFVIESPYQDVPGQGNVFAEAHVQAPPNYPGKNIVFYIGDGVETWTPNTIKKTGIGGSELMAMELAKRLASMGNAVTVYNSCGKWGEGIYDGVQYLQSEKYHDISCEVLIVSRNAQAIDDKYKVSAKLKLLWVHDVHALNATNELLLKFDRILALSNWHKQNLVEKHNLHPDHIIVTRNGIDLNRFNKDIKRNKFKAINSSSPDRSWPVLLECWSEIKKQVPEAELHLYYGFKNWEFFAGRDPSQMALINNIKTQISNLSSSGVVFHDRINQEQLAEEMLSAGALLYPTWFSETFFISGVEAQAAGLRIVTSPIAAINETVGDRSFAMIPGNWTSPEYKEMFIKESVKALTEENDSDRDTYVKYAREHFSLDSLAKEWSNMFSSVIDELKDYPLVPYMPTINYRK